MPTYKTVIPVAQADAENLADLLTEMLDPPPAVCASETDGAWTVEAYFTDLPAAAGFAAIGETFPDYAVALVANLAPVEDEDWVAKVQRGLHPIEAGRFFVHGSHDRDRAAGKAFAIEIDAGQAFGTAHHGTTRGCLLALDSLAKATHIESTLDVGTGSGVLAIAAAMALRGEVLATDIDPVAIDVARENFARNGVSTRIDTLVATGLRHPAIAARAPFELVTANILAAPLLSLAPSIAEAVAAGGYLILSGILVQQAREVGARYMAQGFRLVARYPLDEWSTLLMQRV